MTTCYIVFLTLVVTSCASTAAGLSCLVCNKCDAKRTEGHKTCKDDDAMYCVNSTTSKGVISRGCGKALMNYTEGCHEHGTMANVVCRCDSDDCNGPEVSEDPVGTTQLVGIIGGVIFLVALTVVCVIFACRYWNRCPYYVGRNKPNEDNHCSSKKDGGNHCRTKQDSTKQDITKPNSVKQDNTIRAKPQEDVIVAAGPSRPPPKTQETVELPVPKPMKSPQILSAIEDVTSGHSVFSYFR